MPVDVSTANVRARPKPVERMAERMLVALRLEVMELSVMLTDDRAIHALNRAHRGIDEPTDVLAFSQHEDHDGTFVPFAPSKGAMLGDIVISLETARAQARDSGVSLLEMLALLIAHGLLHLLGCDHRNAAEDRRMRARTQLLAHAGRRGVQGRPIASKRSRDRAFVGSAIASRSRPGAKKARQIRG